MNRLLKAIIIVLCLTIGMTASAQPTTMGSYDGGAMAYFLTGGRMLNLTDLDRRLVEEYDTRFNTSFFMTVGGGGQVTFGSIILEGEGQRIMGITRNTDSYQIELQGSYGLFNVGLAPFRPFGIRLYPLLGVGRGTMELKISERAVLPLDTTEAQSDYPREFSSSSILFNLGLGMDYILNLSGEEMDKTVLVMGLRGGYILSPFDDRWEFAGTPRSNMSGFYFRFMIGGGALY